MNALKLDMPKWLFPAPEGADDDSRVPAGLYHFHRFVDGEHIRYHLRVDEDGPAILIAAASEALLLSPTGAAIAKAILEDRKGVVQGFSSAAVADVTHALDDLGHSSVRYPIFNLVDPAYFDIPWRLTAPFQADVDVVSSTTTLRLIDQLWAIRIPHIRLVVTPRTDRDALVDLVVHAEDLGMIAGVRAPNIHWYQEETIRRLAQAGLDYVVFPFVVDGAWHDSLFGHGDRARLTDTVAHVLAWEMTPVATLPVLPDFLPQLSSALDSLQQVGVHHVELFAIVERHAPVPGLPLERRAEPAIVEATAAVVTAPRRAFYPHELRQLAGLVEDLADARHMQIVWLPPHARQDDLPLETWITRGPRAGGDVTIRLDGEGNVFPPRGPEQTVGNVLVDPWPEIWNHPAFRRYAGRLTSHTRCAQCPGMAICASDCPAESVSWVLP